MVPSRVQGLDMSAMVERVPASPSPRFDVESIDLPFEEERNPNDDRMESRNMARIFN